MCSQSFAHNRSKRGEVLVERLNVIGSQITVFKSEVMRYGIAISSAFKLKCPKRGFIFSPDTVFADFEISIHTAIQKTWTESKIKGCRFHLAQSWWRKIQAISLTNDFRTFTEISKFLKSFFGLPFLPPEMVGDVFVSKLIAIAPTSFEEFTDYIILDNYISENSKFPPHTTFFSTDKQKANTMLRHSQISWSNLRQTTDMGYAYSYNNIKIKPTT
ncbi:hypothetical protein QTP88_008523 [Uroleucon formosanum]